VLVCGTATGEVGPATLDAINKVLGVLLAASAAKQSEAAAATSSQGASEVAQRGGSAERQPRSILRNAAERQPTSAETTEHGAAGSTYQQPSSLQRQTSGTAEMAQRRSTEQSVRLPSYAERAALERQPVSTAATPSHRQLPPPSSSEPEPPRKSFLKVIDHQYQPPPPASGRSGSSELGRRDEPALGPDYQQQRGRAPPHDDSRRLDTDRYAAGHAADGRYPGDVAAAGQYYGGGRSRPGGGGGGGGEFWHEMSAYCAEYEATVGRLDELERRRRAAAAADDPYRRRQLVGVSDEAAAEELERRRRYRLAALDDWREAELRHAAAARPDDYPPARY